jgi:hypothetical protein
MNKQLMTRALAGIFLFAVFAVAAYADNPIIQISLLNLKPNPPQSGGIVEVQLSVQNIGSAAANDIWIEASPDYPFSLIKGYETRQNIPILPSTPLRESSTTVTYKFHVDPESPEGEYELDFRYSLNKGQGWALLNFSVPISSSKFSENIGIDKTLLVPGKETPLTFTVHNAGSAPLQNAMFSWTDPKGAILPLGSGNSRYIGYLAPGESMPLEYLVMASVNANPDLYTINMTLQYDVSGANQTTKTSVTSAAGIFVGGETDFDITFSESTQGQTSLSVANIGITPAYSVTVRIPLQEGYRVDGSTTSIVGNLDKGDYTIVSFQINPTNGMNRTGQGRPTGIQAPQPKTLLVNIEYTDTTGARRTVEKYVPVQFRQATAAGTTAGQTNGGQFGRQRTETTSTSATYVPIAILIIIGIWAAYRFRSKFFGRGKRSA